MLYNIDKIIVLSLIKNKNSVEAKFNAIFEKDKGKLYYYYVKGVGSKRNDGKMNTTFLQILQHSETDIISQDIFKNHINIMRLAKERKWKNILVLEEDSYLATETKQVKGSRRIKILEKWIEEKRLNNIDILYLGYLNWPYAWTSINYKDPFIVYPKSPLLLHAYILTENGRNRVLSFLEKNNKYYEKDMHIDKFLLLPSLGLQKAALYPQMFYQKPPALFQKATDMLNLKVSFIKVLKINEFISIFIQLFITFFFYLFCIYFISRIVSRFLCLKKNKVYILR